MSCSEYRCRRLCSGADRNSLRPISQRISGHLTDTSKARIIAAKITIVSLNTLLRAIRTGCLRSVHVCGPQRPQVLDRIESTCGRSMKSTTKRIQAARLRPRILMNQFSSVLPGGACPNRAVLRVSSGRYSNSMGLRI